MVKKIIKTAFNKLGYSFVKNSTYKKLKRQQNRKDDQTSKNSLLETFFSNIREQGFDPSAIYDIGANKGTWTKECLSFFPNANYYLFEPQVELKKDINSNFATNKNLKIYSLGVGDKNEILKFTMHSRDDSRSFQYSEKEAQSLGFDQVELPIVRLDTFIEQNKLPSPDLLKIDAEGFDIKVLMGAGKYLSETEVVLVEVGVMNKEIPNNAKDVLNFMDEQGFRLFEITDLNRPFKNNILWLCEFVFIKKNGMLDKDYTPQNT